MGNSRLVSSLGLSVQVVIDVRGGVGRKPLSRANHRLEPLIQRCSGFFRSTLFAEKIDLHERAFRQCGRLIQDNNAVFNVTAIRHISLLHCPTGSIIPRHRPLAKFA